tara:strand:- start:2296 stop:3798 length:1503 start_codon:yes stop_codon:yes gene_type:complete
MGDEIEVAELFAGVGGFRLGLEGHPDSDEDTGFKVVFSNQWEPPGTGKQWASKIYEMHFGKEGHTNEDIHDIAFNEGEMAETIRERIPEHDLLVGGFPCQDYSVARTVSGELGIKGEKGKLWIPIRNIIRHKRPRPKVVLLENVPRLLNSPANARGLNFAIILNDLLSMGYEVEWRVINAADYGMPQQRSRVFILAYRTPGSGTSQTAGQRKINGPEKFGASKKIRGAISKWLLGKSTSKGTTKWETGPFAEAFPVTGELGKKFELVPQDLNAFTTKSSPFGNAGYAWKWRSGGGVRSNVFWSTKVKAYYKGGKQKLNDILDEKFDKKYEVDASRIDEWTYAKGSKNEFRIRKQDRDNVDPDLIDLYDKCMSAPFGKRKLLWTQHRAEFMANKGDDKFYQYDEGEMGLDHPEDPSRTVVTAEIGTSPSRMRHIWKDSPGRYRRLSPTETEKLNMFPPDWTLIEGITDSRRGFLMGNALVVGIIERLREPLAKLIRSRSSD